MNGTEHCILYLLLLALFSWMNHTFLHSDILSLEKRVKKLEKQLNDRITNLPSGE